MVRAVSSLAVGLLLACLVAPVAQAGIGPVGSGLPVYEAYAGATHLGSATYLVGGWQMPPGHEHDTPMFFAGPSRSILQIDDSGYVAQVLNATLTAPARSPGVTAVSNKVYTIGGQGGRGYAIAVDRYDPVQQLDRRIGVIYPGRAGAAVFTDGVDLYVAGGWTSAGASDDIWRFDALSGVGNTIGHLPEPWAYGGAAFLDGVAYLFGGTNGTGPSDHILVVYPSGSSEYGKIHLPAPRVNITAASDGTSVYLFGGQGRSGLTGQILRFAPPDSLAVQCDRLPTARMGVAAASVDAKKFLLLGGQDTSGLLNDSLLYEDADCPPIPPIDASFAWTPAATCPRNLEFDAQAQGQAPFSFAWDFGDGSSGTGQVVQHKYASVGSYQVRMTAQGDDLQRVLVGHRVDIDQVGCTDPPAPSTTAPPPDSSEPAATTPPATTPASSSRLTTPPTTPPGSTPPTSQTPPTTGPPQTTRGTGTSRPPSAPATSTHGTPAPSIVPLALAAAAAVVLARRRLS